MIDCLPHLSVVVVCTYSTYYKDSGEGYITLCATLSPLLVNKIGQNPRYRNHLEVTIEQR